MELGQIFWQKLWDNNDTGWKGLESDKLFINNFDKIIKKFKIKDNSKILIPLCGDSKIINFLIDKEYFVTGIDLVKKPLRTIFQSVYPEYEFKKDPLNSYKNLSLVQSNILDCKNSKNFDLIYDRAAFIAMNPKLRKTYLSIIFDSLKESGVYILETYTYESQNPENPPFSINEVELKELVKEFNYLKLESAQENNLIKTLQVFYKN